MWSCVAAVEAVMLLPGQIFQLLPIWHWQAGRWPLWTDGPACYGTCLFHPYLPPGELQFCDSLDLLCSLLYPSRKYCLAHRSYSSVCWVNEGFTPVSLSFSSCSWIGLSTLPTHFSAMAKPLVTTSLGIQNTADLFFTWNPSLLILERVSFWEMQTLSVHFEVFYFLH